MYWLNFRAPRFPDPALAMDSPNGLLAAGGNLDPRTLIQAYRQGIFPWYQEGQPILWWSPDPRAVLFPSNIHLSRSLRKFMRRSNIRLTSDQAFAEVISGCAAPRAQSDGTWITSAMSDAYQELHRLGSAHSVECWHQGQLVGGLYGVATGSVFSGESMFSRTANASKLALAVLAKALEANGFSLIDCQVSSSHLNSLGAESISRAQFLSRLSVAKDRQTQWPDSLQLANVLESIGC